MSHHHPDPTDPATARFVTHILGISEQALIFLGHTPNPLSGRQEQSLPMAGEVIDHLEMLEMKTRGNLGKDESQILRDVLTRLRLAYAEECSRTNGETAEPGTPDLGAIMPQEEPAEQGERRDADPKISGDHDTGRPRFHKTYD